jgi:hypothetical protein
MGDQDLQPYVDLVKYMHHLLCERITVKKIAKALKIFDTKQLKRLLTKAVGHKFFVFHLFTVDELSNKIQAPIPI